LTFKRFVGLKIQKVLWPLVFLKKGGVI
jgi:hypothetical protein